jgi:hypothetical protein
LSHLISCGAAAGEKPKDPFRKDSKIRGAAAARHNTVPLQIQFRLFCSMYVLFQASKFGRHRATDNLSLDARAETRLESFLQVLCSVAIPL